MAESRTLKLSILADVEDLKKNLSSGEKEVEGFGTKVAEFGKKAAVAFAAAAVAAAAYAAKLAVEGVKAAIDDEAAQAKLQKTLENVTGATEAQTKAVEDYITQTSLQIGVSDDQLRPSLDRLVRATKDVEEAQKLQTLALDISAGSGKSLETVTNALAKAQEGQLGGLTRLGVGITAAEASTMSFEEITAKLGETFKGQAQAQTETFQGRIQKLKVAFDEAKESVGAALLPILETLLTIISEKILPVINTFASSFSLDTGLGSKVKEFIDLVKQTAQPVIEGLQGAFTKVKNAIVANKDSFDGLFALIKRVAPIIGTIIGKVFGVIGSVAATVVSIFSKVIDGILGLINFAIKGINLIIKGYNLIPGVKDIKTISEINVSTPKTELPKVPTIKESDFKIPAEVGGGAGGGRSAPITNNVTVNGAIDSESTARQIVQVLNEAQSRGTGGGGGLRAYAIL